MNPKNRQWMLLITLLILILGVLCPTPQGMSPIQQKSLVLLLVSVLLWSTELLPVSISSLLIVVLQLVFHLTNSFQDSVQGYLTSAIYFVLAVSMVSQVLIKVGLDRILARAVMRLAKGSINQTAVLFVLLVMVLPIIMPSAMARLRMFTPLIEEINRLHGLQSGSSLVRFGLWCFGGLNQVTTMVVLTGGAFAILAAQLISEFGQPMSWTRWFFLVSPPVYLSVSLTALFMWLYWKVGSLKSSAQITDQIMEVEFSPSFRETSIANPDGSPTHSSKHLALTAIILVLMLIAWIFGEPWGIPEIVPPVFALLIFGLPNVGLLENKDFRNYDWENFLLIGSALSLSATLQANGTADWLSQTVFSAAHTSTSGWINMLLLIIAVLLLRLAFISPSAAVSVILPFSLTYGTTVGLPKLDVVLTTTLLIGSVVILPNQSPTMMLAYQSGYFTMKDQWVIGSILIVSIVIASLLAGWLIW